MTTIISTYATSILVEILEGRYSNKRTSYWTNIVKLIFLV